MHISIVAFDGFNELDSLIALGILNRVKKPGWRVSVATPSATIRSMNGLVMQGEISLAEACKADAVLVSSGVRTRDAIANPSLMAELQLDPVHQLIGAQCSGTLMLAKLGLLNDIPACTDLKTKPWVVEAGTEVLNQPFFAAGNIATAGGCLASQYLAAWFIARLAGLDAARDAVHWAAPVGEKDVYVARALANISPFLPLIIAASNGQASE